MLQHVEERWEHGRDVVQMHNNGVARRSQEVYEHSQDSTLCHAEQEWKVQWNRKSLGGVVMRVVSRLM